MGCRKFQAWLPLMADCLLSDKQQILLDEHLSTCPQCQKEALLYKSIVERCCQLPTVDLPCDFYERLSFSLKLECTQSVTSPKPWVWRMPLMVGSLSAAALLAILIISPNKNATTPATFISTFPTKSQAAKLAPLLNPTQPIRMVTNASSHHSQPNKSVSTTSTITEMTQIEAKNDIKNSVEEKQRSITPDEQNPEVSGMSAGSPAAPSAKLEEQIPQQQPLLRAATFGAPTQFIPAYTVPHNPATTQSDLEFSTTTMVTDRLQTDIPLRPKPDCMIVRNPIQLQQAMEKANQSTPLFTDLDWKKQMLAAISLDPTLCPGYQLQLDAIEQMPEKICVNYKVQRPTSVVPVNAPSPSLFLVLPYSDLPVEFSEQ